jgi:Nucleotidyl transferase AbiEii toxin, Type IV TA system
MTALNSNGFVALWRRVGCWTIPKEESRPNATAEPQRFASMLHPRSSRSASGSAGTLKRIFSVPAPPAGLLFKGGTSLSEVFGAIARFSEDVDLSFDRAGVGFGGEIDPLNTTRAARVIASPSHTPNQF